MIMHPEFRRRVRIISKPDSLIGWHVEIRDVETGEGITNICGAVIRLIPGEYNAVEFTYHEADPTTELLLIKDGDIVKRQKRVSFPEVDLTVWERNEGTT